MVEIGLHKHRIRLFEVYQGVTIIGLRAEREGEGRGKRAAVESVAEA